MRHLSWDRQTWNWRKVAYYGLLVLLVPAIILSFSVLPTIAFLIGVAATRSRPVTAWFAAGAPEQ